VLGAREGAGRGPRALLLVPNLRGGGNAVSARRLAAGLAARGVPSRLLAADAPRFPQRLGALHERFRPTVVHAFHARKAGAVYLRHRMPGDPPLVLTLTGTEIHRDLADPERGAEVLAALDGAAVVLSHGRALRDAAVAAAPRLEGRIRLAPKGVAVPAPRGRARRRSASGRVRGVVFLLPAGLREVKDPLFAAAPLARLRAEGIDARFVHAGERTDPALAASLARLGKEAPWVRSLGPVPHARMAGRFAAADVVLNTSRAEGLSNAVAEAMACGRAVLASDIPANRELVSHGRTGLLYRVGDAASFLRSARRLALDPALRRRLGEAAARDARKRFSVEAETEAVREAYRQAEGGEPASEER
jgi:glycosyltransferase involved in cell wall biosynthesis